MVNGVYTCQTMPTIKLLQMHKRAHRPPCFESEKPKIPLDKPVEFEANERRAIVDC